uniref:AbrB/MazE/SpoVT family DNA-binding domain-containing protein n=1 Tax=uncultured Thiotrichaceae bacterium TaxID=298394 RepID=A0A6S6TEI5_9GAMM|nr:MAG: AbrB/MazE/SpoVT family DNA-binding domain-containing protein [uncultured Thiotrichaceae bacterium]
MTHMATIGKSGRLVIPATLRKALGLNEGDGVTIAVKEGHIEISPVAVSIKKAQDLVKKHLKPEDDLVEMLFEERREAINNEH